MYVQRSNNHQPSLGVDPIECDPGEEWDWTAMSCVTAGQATTPTPPIPTLPPFVTTPPIMAPPPPPPEPTFYERYKTPIWVAGAVTAALVVGYMITPSATATPNKKPTSVKALKTRLRAAKLRSFRGRWKKKIP